MSGENGKKEKGLNDYGIIYLSGPIEVETSESVCKEIIEYNISGKTDYIQMIINSPGRHRHRFKKPRNPREPPAILFPGISEEEVTLDDTETALNRLETATPGEGQKNP